MPVERPAPLRQAVYDALVELIVKRTLKPGQHLVEGELAEQLGVSRQPVREALQRLQVEGWVDLRPAHGAFVHEPTEDEVDQLLAVRCLLETESARLAARATNAAAVKDLKKVLRTGKAALADGDMAEVVAANSELHGLVTRMSGNAVLGELIGLVERRVRWYYMPLARTRGAVAWKEHTELIDAIAKGDEDRAADIMHTHTEETRVAAQRRPAAEDEPAKPTRRR
ncbi:MAG TPA: GntR family transcriptional regulator [Pseudonocardiaceae bacterium]|jgi:DNA-binding GntR family transcriptional regulator|nr:GntR family transcriptional regulator [Pseudonocardiaceae bacterium]